MSIEEIETFTPASRREWRQWLKKNHQTKQSVWLVCYKKNAGMPTITWSDAVDEALCHGWIDSKRVSLDENRFRQFFCRRKAKSTWSKVNKEKVQRLIDENLMTAAGHAVIATARDNGSWTTIDEVEELIIPKDLDKAFRTHRGAKKFFLSLSRSVRKAMLQWVVLAKREETRARRMVEIAELAGRGERPEQF